MTLVPIDFEYSGTSEQKLDLICCSFEWMGDTFEYWLRDKARKESCKQHLLALRSQGIVFVCWNGIAEGQSFISLGIHPVKCKWIDVQAEWKMLTNHCAEWMYGKQLVEGKVRNIPIPSWGDAKFKAKTNMAAGCYKLLGIQIDTKHKDDMRQICIRADEDELTKNRDAIQEYCTSDIKHLVQMWDVIKGEFNRRGKKITYRSGDVIDNRIVKEEVLFRGETMARAAIMTSTGYPVDVDALKTFAANVPDILKELCEDINNNLDVPIFRWNNSRQSYSMFQAPIKEWVENSEYEDKWLKTDKDDYSLSLPAWEKFFSYSHDYPLTLPGQVLRFLKTRRSLNGFLPKAPTAKNKETFFDSLGTDGRVRSYLNPYGSQSARYQPKATSFIPLKAAWMRSMIMPKKGRAMCAIDYKSEEFLLGGLVSGDKNMLEAYKSGDVYLYFAKLAGAVPWEGTKESYKAERNLFKATTLGISYLMGPAALGRKLSSDTGKVYSTQDAQDLIDKFNNAYPDYSKWQESAYYTYKKTGIWKLPCGWSMFGDNPNERSIKNMPIQGIGSSILRKAIALAQDAGLMVCYPLHDALYIEYDSNDLGAVDVLAKCMVDAFAYYFTGVTKTYARNLIQLDIDVWSREYAAGRVVTPNGTDVSSYNIYIDPRSVKEYERFSKYMKP